MSAIELFLSDGRRAGIWHCSECRIVNPDKQQAEWCHEPRLCACGQPTRGRHYSACVECEQKERRAKEDAKEQARFDKATKVEAKDYTGEHVYWGDEYYETIEDAIDEFPVGEEPKYVWATKNVGVQQADIGNIIDPILTNIGEDADPSCLNGIEELEAAINAFNEANKSVVLWQVDYSIAVLIPKAETEEQEAA